ncbi:unnamed protein product, partial [Rotaria magnacalcarata]
MPWSFLKRYPQVLVLTISSTVAVAGCLWRAIKRYPSSIIMVPTEENKFIVDQCPSFNE